jgi:hypothetical protein
MNVAAVRGDDMSQCEDYYSSQVCQQIVGEFWYLVDGYLKMILINYLMNALKEKIEQNVLCPDFWYESTSVQKAACNSGKLIAIAGWFLQLLSTIETIEQIMGHEWLSNKEIDQGAKQRLNSE